ncbi:MAG: 4Fe-4S dicluster domain-containing protein [Spirochaetaceae bacterium]|jgi:NAD(P)H-flavin reductase/formate hydrogenlyase subunit 6/NADH:ubiquinone oxidoreductase subunit I|nr:4Fe-4S dicluster domain-containing protein [Spirochaetaceae bacterium]
MKTYFIKDQDFSTFITNVIESENLIGPIAKKNKFVFDKLEKPEDLRLDYDVTLLPPKKFFFPPAQKLIEFDGEKYHDCIDPKKMILLGVHFYDIKSLDMTDFLFSEGKADNNYMANRSVATVIGSNIQNISDRAFWGCIGREVKPKGHDGFLTKLENGNGYVFDVISHKAESLLTYGIFRQASEDETSNAKRINEEAMLKCTARLPFPSDKLAEKVRAEYNNEELWDELAEGCFSCGTCNTVCPTCYCFDVHDQWNLDQKSGSRIRYWDACLTSEFAKVSLGAGSSENFRNTRGERFRHRIMRKAVYLNDKLGGPACVGCGRCSTSCTADIADPARVYNRIMELEKEAEIAAQRSQNVFMPKQAMILRAHQATATEKHFTLKMADGSSVHFEPGQMLEVSLFGYGEIPIGYASSPTRTRTFDIVVRSVGRVSKALNKLEVGDSMFIRGPLGHGFPLEQLRNQNVLIIAGGIGLCPTRSLIQYIMDRRDEFNDFTLFYGTRSPSERMFLDDLTDWHKSPDINFFETVDTAEDSWEGNIGVITTLFEKNNIPSETRVIICGPPVMYKFVLRELDNKGISHNNIYVDLERRMKCGIGKCGHCQINDKYVCKDGPVFPFSEVEDLEEAL